MSGARWVAEKVLQSTEVLVPMQVQLREVTLQAEQRSPGGRKPVVRSFLNVPTPDAAHHAPSRLPDRQDRVQGDEQHLGREAEPRVLPLLRTRRPGLLTGAAEDASTRRRLWWRVVSG